MKNETLEKYYKAELMFKDGKTLMSIAKELHLDRGKFATWLRNKGYQTKENFEVKYEQGKEMYLNGISLTQIAEKLKLSAVRLSKWLKKNGVEIRENRTYTCNESYFEVINTEEKAYWLGFLYADGCVCRSGKVQHLEVTLQENDIEHLKKFLKSIGSNTPTHKKVIKLNDKKYKAYRVNIGSARMCQDLIKIGCTPRKSLTLKFPSKEILSEELVLHFVRGYIDGDGWIGISTNKHLARIGVLGTQNFLLGIQESMHWKKVSIRECNRGSKAFVIEYNSSETINYLNEIYKNANIYLDRKYEKYKEIYAVLTQRLQKS